MFPNITRITKEVVENIRDMAILGALAFNAIHGYAKDDVSETQAYKEYGKKWVQDRVARGLINFTRVGESVCSTKYYSRFEIECLKRAEKKIKEELNYELQQGIEQQKKTIKKTR